MQLSFSILDFLMLALVVQGFVLSGLLFYSSKTIISNRYLGALIFIVSESTLIMELDYSGIWAQHPWLRLVVMHFDLAAGPIIYLYVQSLIFNINKLTWKCQLNFLPLLLEMKYKIIYLLYITHILSIPFIQHIYFLTFIQQMLFGGFPLTTTVAIISVFAYSIITYRDIDKYSKQTLLSTNKIKELKWVKNLLRFIFVFIAIWIFSFIVNTAFAYSIMSLWDHYILYIPAIVMVYLLGMAAYSRQNQMLAHEKAECIQKPIKIYFTGDEALNYKRQLTHLMISDRIFLNPLLKVDDVAVSIAISPKGLSHLLNHYMDKNFNDFVNEFRVEEVKKRLSDPAHHHFTIAAIAFDCGFNSLPTFQRVFKQLTGTTPSSYQNHNFPPQPTLK